MKWKLLVAALALGGCTMGVDGSFVGIGGAVIAPQSADVDSAFLEGEGVALDMSGDAGQLDVRFAIDDEGTAREVELEIRGGISNILHGGDGEARLVIDGLTGEDGVEAELTVRSASDGTYVLQFVAMTGNGEVRGTVVIEITEGHC